MAGIEDLSVEQRRQLELGSILLKNPEIAMQAKRLAKKANPELRIPEVELEDRLDAERQAREKDMDKLRREQMERDVNARREKERAQCTAEGLDPDEVEKRVVQEGKDGNPMTMQMARRIMNLERQVAEPTGMPEGSHSNPMHTPIDMRPAADVRKLTGNALRRWSADTARDMVNQFRGRPRGRAGA